MGRPKKNTKKTPLMVKGELQALPAPELKNVEPKALGALSEEEAIEKNRLEEETNLSGH